ncbi:MAG: hypothetical protein ACM3VS_11520 [Candidatus Dadabacteria bacterium]
MNFLAVRKIHYDRENKQINTERSTDTDQRSRSNKEKGNITIKKQSDNRIVNPEEEADLEQQRKEALTERD